MPPLCVVGIGLAKQNFEVLSGAFLLFLANMIAINVAAIAMFELAGFPREFCDSGTCTANGRKKTTYRMLYPIVLLVVISIPLAFIMYKTYSHANTEKVINSSLIELLDIIAPHSTLISVKYQEQVNRYEVDAAFRTTKIIVPENIRQMENLLELRLGKPVGISADVVLVQKVNDKENIDSFQALLPKVKEKEIVEVIKSSTPEDVIESVLREKLALLPNSKLDDYTFEYRKGAGTYKVTAKISSSSLVDDKLSKTIQNILEEQLKRRVEVKLQTVVEQSKSVTQ